MATYSLAATGAPAQSLFAVANLDIPDDSPSNDGTRTQGTWGGQQSSARLNLPMLCQGPDGSVAWYTIDAERSRQGAIVLRAV